MNQWQSISCKAKIVKMLKQLNIIKLIFTFYYIFKIANNINESIYIIKRILRLHINFKYFFKLII